MQAHNKILRHSLFIFALLTCTAYVPLHGRTRVLFSPDDKPQEHLINFIKKAKNRIYVAIYMFTDKEIAEALIEAKNRGIDVQVISDQTSVNGKYGKMGLISKSGVSAFVFKPTKKNAPFRWSGPLMHNKFAIIDDEVWTGSFNWTVAANKRNQENIVCIDEKDVCSKYLARFEKLKTRSVAV